VKSRGNKSNALKKKGMLSEPKRGKGLNLRKTEKGLKGTGLLSL